MVSTLLVGMLGGCGKKDDGKIDIGVSIANFDDTFLMYMKDGMEAYAKEHGDKITIEFVDAAEDMAKQMDQVENFVVQKKDAIVVVPVDTSATAPITKKATDAKTPLVYVNRNPGNLPEGAYYVGSQDVVAGRLQMEWLAEALNGKGNVAILIGKLDNEGALARTKGNEEVAADFPDINIVEKQTGKWQRNDGMMVTEDWLNKYGTELNAVLCNNDDMALGAAQALKDAGREDILVLGVDVILDFGFWDRSEREEFRSRAKELGVDFKLHFNDISKEELFERLRTRNAQKPDATFVIHKNSLVSAPVKQILHLVGKRIFQLSPDQSIDF